MSEPLAPERALSGGSKVAEVRDACEALEGACPNGYVLVFIQSDNQHVAVSTSLPAEHARALIEQVVVAMRRTPMGTLTTRRPA